MEDQRSELPQMPPAPTVPDDDFFGLLQRLQASRYEDQRSSLAPLRPVSSADPLTVISNGQGQGASSGQVTSNGTSSSNGDSRKSAVLQKLNSLPGRKSKKGKH